MVILDTSYWIEFLKNKAPNSDEVRRLLEDRHVIGLSFVMAELLQGCRSEREVNLILAYWESIPKIDESNIWIEAGRLSYKKKLFVKGIGIIDAAILVVSIRFKYLIQLQHTSFSLLLSTIKAIDDLIEI